MWFYYYRSLAGTVGDSALGQVIRGHFDLNLVPGQYPDVVFAHLAGNMCHHYMAVFQFDLERCIGKGVDHLAFKLNTVFFRHSYTSWICKRLAKSSLSGRHCAATALVKQRSKGFSGFFICRKKPTGGIMPPPLGSWKTAVPCESGEIGRRTGFRFQRGNL